MPGTTAKFKVSCLKILLHNCPTQSLSDNVQEASFQRCNFAGLSHTCPGDRDDKAGAGPQEHPEHRGNKTGKHLIRISAKDAMRWECSSGNSKEKQCPLRGYRLSAYDLGLEGWAGSYWLGSYWNRKDILGRRSHMNRKSGGCIWPRILGT